MKICPINAETMAQAIPSADVRASVQRWSSQAADDDRMLYFAVCVDGQIVGQIFLHDIDWEKRESLVGYHLFETWRGRGVGTKALRLLQRCVIEDTSLQRLVVITANKQRGFSEDGCDVRL